MFRKSKDLKKLPRINGKVVRGKAYLQPGCNPWIGIFWFDEDFIKCEITQKKTMEILFEGPFFYRKNATCGQGKGKIIHIRRNILMNKIVINVRGIGDPECESDMNDHIKFTYNSNLPITNRPAQVN